MPRRVLFLAALRWPTRSQCVCAWKRSDRAYGARRSNESLEDVRERFRPMIEQDRPLRTTTMASFAGTGNRVDSLFFPLLFSCSAAVIFGRSLDSTGVFADFQICLPPLQGFTGRSACVASRNVSRAKNCYQPRGEKIIVNHCSTAPDNFLIL